VWYGVRNMAVRSVLWFRKGLRLHDNQALLVSGARAPVVRGDDGSSCMTDRVSAQDGIKDASALFPVFVIDPWFVTEERVGRVRMRFLLETLTNLDEKLRKLNSRLVSPCVIVYRR
jgi:cryptochrome